MKNIFRKIFVALAVLWAVPDTARAETQTFSTLAPGWNLLTFQVVPSDPSPEAVWGSLPGFQSAWTYDASASASNWTRFIKSASASKDALENSLPSLRMQPIAIGKAYWVFLGTAPAQWQVTGALPQSVPAVDFRQGWNFIGIPTGTTEPIREPVNLLSVLTKAGFDYDTILRWEASSQSYKHYSTSSNKNTTAQNFVSLDPNSGILANVLTPAVLKPELVVSVRTDIDFEPTGNFPGPEDLNISGASSPTPPVPVGTQNRIVFFPDEDVQTLSLSNMGGGIMLWEVVWDPADRADLAQPWLSLAFSASEPVVQNQSGATVRDYKRLNGVTTVENDVIYLRLDRRNLAVGTYRGTLTLRTSTGASKVFQVEANVPGLQGDWKGFAIIETVNGKKNPVPDIDLAVSFYEDSKIPGLMRGAIDSTQALLWPMDVSLVGYRRNSQGNAFQISGAFVLPPGDQNYEPLDVFDPLKDVDWNHNKKIDSLNPLPFPIHRHVTLSGLLEKGSPMTGYTITGRYTEVVTGMLRRPIQLEGSFTLNRLKSVPFASRVKKAGTDTGTEPVIYKQELQPRAIPAGGNNFGFPLKFTVNTDQELRSLSVELTWSTLTHTSLLITLVSPDSQTLLIHDGKMLNPNNFRSVSFPRGRPTAGSLTDFLAQVKNTKGEWQLRIQNNGPAAVTLGNWSLQLEGQAVFNVVGYVKNAGEGVPNVPVSLSNLPYSQTTVTDSTGKFTMNRVPNIPVNFSVTSPAYQAADPLFPGLTPSFTVPSYSNLNATEAALAANFQPMPSAPVSGSGVSGYGFGTSLAPFVLNVKPVASAGSAAISGGPVQGFAPLYVDFAAVNPAGSTMWNFGDGTTSASAVPPEKVFQLPRVYTVQLDSPSGGAVEDSKQFIAMPTVRNAPASPAAVVAGASSTPYGAYCFQPFFTSGGAVPAGVSLPTTAGSYQSSTGALYADLIMLQHTYAANFDLDLAPKTALNADFAGDNFGVFAPSTFVLHPANDAFSDTVNLGYQQEDHNYTLWQGKWISSQVRGLDQGMNRSYTVKDTILHPPNRIGAVEDGVSYQSYRLTCNLGPTLLPAEGLGSLAVESCTSYDPLQTKLVEGTSGFARNTHFILLTGPMAPDWVYQSPP